MKKKMIFGALFISSILLIVPSTSSFHLIMENKSEETIFVITTDTFKDLNEQSTNSTPPWFTLLNILIMHSLRIRILFITPLAVTFLGGFPGEYEIKSYILFFILITQIYRFAFWYNFLDKIAEKNNWEFP